MQVRWTSSIACRPMISRILSRRPAALERVVASPRRFAILALAFGAATLAGCAQQPQGSVQARSKEYFPEGKYGVASPRVVADGQDVPRGGGRYHVGKPYTIAGKTYYPSDRKVVSTGTASWYGEAFHGRRTANGEIFDRHSITAAHPTMPLPSYARVTNMRNNHSIVVRVNDRGPYHGGRVMDVSQRVADALDFKRFGTARIRIEQLGKAGLGGSDDKKLLASLRTDGSPAQLEGYATGPATMMAEAPASQRVAALQKDNLRTISDDDGDEAPAAPAKTAAAGETTRVMSFDGHAPAPPPRPFDLGTIPGAATPIAAKARTATR
jgi:rare lipoprotein A